MQTKPQRTSDQMPAGPTGWDPIVKEYLSTQLSQRAFCKENQIEIHAFRYWLSKYGEEMVLCYRYTNFNFCHNSIGGTDNCL